MIVFYPNKDLGEIWSAEFCFDNDITLVTKSKTDYKSFFDRNELIGFLKTKGFKLTENPLRFESFIHPHLGHGCKVIQQVEIGFIKESP